MDADRTDLVTEWEAETVSDGFAGLARLADRGFSGVVTDAAVRIYLLNGRIVGVTGGSLSAFEDASGTAYTAPDESLPLLFAMQARGGEQKAQYYTNDTPISEADRTLSKSNFTGYIELSENVLSGDYYIAYYGGESFPVAFIGNAEQLKTGSEAFERADDEVGIYTVHEVDLEVQDVPEPASAPTSAAVSGQGSFDDADTTTASSPDADSTSAADSTSDTDASTGDDASDTPTATDGTDGTEAANESEATEPSGVAGDAESIDASETPSDAAVTDRDDAPDPTDEAVTMGTAAETDRGPAADDDETRSTTATPSTEDATTEDAESAGGENAPAGGDDGATSGSTGDHRSSTERRSTERGSTERRSTERRSTERRPSEQQSGDRSDGEPTSPTEPRSTRNRQSADDRDEAATRSDRSDPAAARDARGREQNATQADGEPPADENVFSQEAEWREAKSIPSIDPSETRAHRSQQAADDGTPSEAAESAGKQSGARHQPSRSAGEAATTQRSTPTRRSVSNAESAAATPQNQSDAAGQSESQSERGETTAAALRTRVERLENELAEATERRDQLETDRDRIEAERDQIADERDELRAEAEQLQDRVAELESTLERVRGDLEDARSQLPEGDRVMSPGEALSETNLFVRYGSKGGATLEKAHDGSIERDELINNLRIEHHTSFEDERVVVDGQPYREFLVETMEYGFTNWVVTELLFEIRDTGNVSGLQDLYDAIPRIDRAEIGGSVSLTYESDGEEHREQQTFDLVLRDRMGNPLVVADLNDSRDPTPEGTLEGLVETGSQLAEGTDEFTAGVAVTSSFFDPGALEAAEDATGGGLLSRSKKRSFVKVARKRGFHLCLAEARDRGFHLTVPEL